MYLNTKTFIKEKYEIKYFLNCLIKIILTKMVIKIITEH